MSLQAVLREPALSDDSRERVTTAIDNLDGTVKQLRQTIYALTSTGSETVTLRRRVMHEVETYSSLIDSAPALTFDGPVDSIVTEKVADQAVAALRELLSNAVKHAQAHHLSVSVQILDNNLVVTVADDGVGIADTARRSGLANLEARAAALGGTFEATRRSPSGTRAKWSVPAR